MNEELVFMCRWPFSVGGLSGRLDSIIFNWLISHKNPFYLTLLILVHFFGKKNIASHVFLFPHEKAYLFLSI